MKIREHRGGLRESMETAKEIPANIESVANYFEMFCKLVRPKLSYAGKIVVEKYSDRPDERIGWKDTWIVMYYGPKHFFPLGFTDGPVSGEYPTRTSGDTGDKDGCIGTSNCFPNPRLLVSGNGSPNLTAQEVDAKGIPYPLPASGPHRG